MAKSTVRIEGADELKRKLEALSRKARGPILERAGLAGAEVIRDRARAKAPGPEIEAEVAKIAEFAVEIEIGPDEDHWYYRFAETGAGGHPIGGRMKKALRFPGDEGETLRFAVYHPGRPADPFLRPALEAGASEATQAVAEVLRREIAQVTRSGG